MPDTSRAKATRKTEQTERRRTCTRCGRIGHLSSTCEAPEKRHDMIGIEIEGFWRDLPGAQRIAADMDVHGVRDGSLPTVASCRGKDADCDCDGGCDACEEISCERSSCGACGCRSWEFQTVPGSIGEALRQLTKLYPDATSGACGMHVHMSFLDRSDVTMLATEEFFSYFRAQFKAWGERANIQGAFWDRLAGDNQYCLVNTRADFQGRSRDGACLVTEGADRYRQINFDSYSEHRTVEFRLLPMFQQASVAVAAVETLVDIVETYLADARLDLDADCTSVDPARMTVDKIAEVAAEIPSEISPAALAQILPPKIEREIEIADMTGVDRARCLPAYKLEKHATTLLQKLVTDHFGPAGSRLRKLGAGNV